MSEAAHPADTDSLPAEARTLLLHGMAQYPQGALHQDRPQDDCLAA